MFRIALLAVAIAATPTGPALAQDAKPAAAEAAPDKNKKVCRRLTATGSVIPKSVCRTVQQWEALTAKSQDDVDRTRAMERSRSAVGVAQGN